VATDVTNAMTSAGAEIDRLLPLFEHNTI
jgi:hypothetical protein